MTKLTIGETSRRTGVPVKTIRFYSDEGLLPPAGRTRSGYRLYGEEHVVRIDLIRTLREAGIGLEAIGKVLRRDVSLEEALRLRLGAVEAHIASLRRVAAVLRAAIRSGASEPDLRRISMVTRASNEERRRIVETFYAKVTEGLAIDPGWVKGMIDTSIPALPDEPTAEQIDAWIELSAILEEPSFVATMRANAAELWGEQVDAAALGQANARALAAARQARERGVEPTSVEAAAITDRLTREVAAASGAPDVPAFRARLAATHDARAERYWELVATMKGEAALGGAFEDWRWLGAAVRHRLSD